MIRPSPARAPPKRPTAPRPQPQRPRTAPPTWLTLSAQRAESLAPTEGLVNSVNGKGGVVVLDAYDVGALPSPATTAGVQAGMLLAVKEVTSDGKIITEAVQPPNDAGFVEITENIPAEQRKAGVLYGLVVMDLSAETEPATFNN